MCSHVTNKTSRINLDILPEKIGKIGHICPYQMFTDFIKNSVCVSRDVLMLHLSILLTKQLNSTSHLPHNYIYSE